MLHIQVPNKPIFLCLEFAVLRRQLGLVREMPAAITRALSASVHGTEQLINVGPPFVLNVLLLSGTSANSSYELLLFARKIFRGG